MRSKAVRLTFAAIASLCSFLSASVAAKVTVNETRSSYVVHGGDAASIKKSLDKHAPLVLKDGRRFHAQTARSLSWSYTRKTIGKKCAVDSVSVSMDLTYTTPKWRKSGAPPRRLARQWSKFEKAVWRHEKGHGALARKLARKAERTIRRTRAQKTCAALDALADKRVKRLMSRDRSDARYDKRTNYGVRQGAYFDAASR